MLRVEGLSKTYPVRQGLLDSLRKSTKREYVRAVDGVNFELARGEVLGLAGESGAGKSTIGRLILRLIESTNGRIEFDGIDVGALGKEDLRKLRSRMQVVFQDPLASLNPRMSIGAAVTYPARLHFPDRSAADLQTLMLKTLRMVGLDPPEYFAERYPHQISGGQRQRIVIARAIITAPDLVVLDEPIAMADVSVRVLLLDLLKSLKDEHDLTYLYITHDLATAKYICDRIAILYLGQIVELGPIDAVFNHASHPYTQSLLAAVPHPDPGRRRTSPLPRGELPDPIDPPPGCRFHPRCPIAREGICDVEAPLLAAANSEGHTAACHFTTGAHKGA
jgi:peptide/nickel transport system ATP-binding protein